VNALGPIVQDLIVGACVAAAMLYALGRYWPQAIDAPRAALAGWLSRWGHARAAAQLQPVARRTSGCHSGGDAAAAVPASSCGTCGQCASAAPSVSPALPTEQTVRFQPRRR